jgi:hypothetical protein
MSRKPVRYAERALESRDTERRWQRRWVVSRRSDELHNDRSAAGRDARIDVQVGNREPVHDVLRSNHEPDRFARRDPYRRRLEGIPGRQSLSVHGLIGGGRAQDRRRRNRGTPPLTDSSRQANQTPTTTA